MDLGWGFQTFYYFVVTRYDLACRNSPTVSSLTVLISSLTLLKVNDDFDMWDFVCLGCIEDADWSGTKQCSNKRYPSPRLIYHGWQKFLNTYD